MVRWFRGSETLTKSQRHLLSGLPPVAVRDVALKAVLTGLLAKAGTVGDHAFTIEHEVRLG